MKSIGNLFRSDDRIRLAYLFGSRARGDAVEGSDYDLAFLTSRSLSLDEQADLNVAVMKALGSDKVDFVFLDAAPILLRFEAVSDGRLLECKLTDEELNAYELAVFREYFHTERFRRLQSESLREAFKTGE